MTKQYEVSLHYKDNVVVEISIEDSEIASFFDDINANQVYRYPRKINHIDRGFWTDISNIRYITVEEIKADSEEKKDEVDS